MRVYALVMGLVLSLGVSSASAQTGASFGVKAGVNFANMDFSGDDAGVSFDQRMGLVAGAFVLVPMTETFGVQIEGLYSQKGSKVDSEDFGGEVRFEFDWFDVPVLARYTIPSSTSTSFHLFAGPSFSFKLGAKSVFEFDGEEEEEEDVDDQFKGFDFGLVIGAGVDFGKFTIDGRYTHGLTDLNDFDEILDDDEIVEVKNRVFSIMAGFRF
jgi:hypothetical protein